MLAAWGRTAWSRQSQKRARKTGALLYH
jgi:hypothetical protein